MTKIPLEKKKKKRTAETPPKPTHLTPLVTLNNFLYHILLYCLKHEWYNIVLPFIL